MFFFPVKLVSFFLFFSMDETEQKPENKTLETRQELRKELSEDN